MTKAIRINWNDNAMALKQISEQYDINRDAILEEAVELLLWAIYEKIDGRRICSVEAVTILEDCVISEFAEDSNGYMYESPLLSKVAGHVYRRPD